MSIASRQFCKRVVGDWHHDSEFVAIERTERGAQQRAPRLPEGVALHVHRSVLDLPYGVPVGGDGAGGPVEGLREPGRARTVATEDGARALLVCVVVAREG